MSTKTKRVTNTIKKNHRSWLWWLLVIGPILFTAWLVFAPDLNIGYAEIERVVEMSSPRSVAPPPEREGGLVDDQTKADIDWMLGHALDFGPLLISILAIWKKKPITGK